MHSLLIGSEKLFKYNKLSLFLFRVMKSSPRQYPRDRVVTYDKSFNRFDLINFLIEKYSFNKYLEIGVSIPSKCFDKVQVETKYGVDPDPSANATHVMTSDEFFQKNTEKFDVIFVDGLHHADQVEKDILNSLDALSDNGFIICHDMNPAKDSHQIVPRLRDQGIWNGDCWKAWVRLRRVRSDVNMRVINADHGLGVVTKGKQALIDCPESLPWALFTKYREYLLNVVSVKSFLNNLK